jgi:hypothetical protein
MRRTALHESGHCVAAITFSIPVVYVSIDPATPHLQRGRYRPPHDAGLESLVVMCLAGPAAERLFCGAIEPGADRIDIEMAREHLARRFAPLQIAAEIVRLRGSAERLVSLPWAQRRRIELIADALLDYGTLSGAPGWPLRGIRALSSRDISRSVTPRPIVFAHGFPSRHHRGGVCRVGGPSGQRGTPCFVAVR